MVTRKRTTIDVFAAIVVIAGAPTVTAPPFSEQPSPLEAVPTSASQKNSAAATILTPTSRVPVYSPALSAVLAGTGSLIEVTVAGCAPTALVTVISYSMIAAGMAFGFVVKLIGSQITRLSLLTDNAAEAITKPLVAFVVTLRTTVSTVITPSAPAVVVQALLSNGLMAV